MRLLITFGTIVLFAAIIFFSLNIQESNQQIENRISLVSNVENSELISKLFPEATGDYLVGFTYNTNEYSAIQINPYLTLLNDDDKSYSYAKDLKEDNQKEYKESIEDTFNVKINDHIKFENDGTIKTNADPSEKQYYINSFNQASEFYKALKNDENIYDPQDNNQWLRVADEFDYETDDLMDSTINKNMVKKLSNKKPKTLKKGTFLSFVNVYNPQIRCADNICKYPQDTFDSIEASFNDDSFKNIDYKTKKLQNYNFDSNELKTDDYDNIEQINQDNLKFQTSLEE